MFGGDRRSNNNASSNVAANQVETIIGKDTLFRGSLSSNSAIRVDGQVEGDITSTSSVIIGVGGNAKANITARSAIIAGRVTGNMDVAEKLELASTATLEGDIKTGVLVTGEGAVFKGACEMRRDEKPDPASPQAPAQPEKPADNNKKKG